METSTAADDMDAILDDALDELDDSDSDSDDADESINVDRSRPQQTNIVAEKLPRGSSETSRAAEENDRRRVPFGPPRPPSATPRGKPNPLPDGAEPRVMDHSLRRMFRDLATEADPLPEPAHRDAPTRSPDRNLHESPSTESATDDDKMLRELFQGLMAAGGDGSTDGGMADANQIPDLDNLFAGLGGDPEDSEGFDSTHFMDGMMEQLLSKELMYEPMKQVTEKFPTWLETRKEELPPEEWDQRNRQYDCLCRLVRAYEGEESEHNTPKLLELMQEVQEFGQPPHEIINEIAPGLELDGDGLPKMNGLPPFLGGKSGEEDCRIM